jgi:hypothetical protein
MEKPLIRRQAKSKKPKTVKYEDVRDHLMRCMKSRQLTFAQIVKCVQKKAKGFRGSIPLYAESIRLDLEARDLIERVPGTKPERYRLRRGK